MPSKRLKLSAASNQSSEGSHVIFRRDWFYHLGLWRIARQCRLAIWVFRICNLVLLLSLGHQKGAENMSDPGDEMFDHADYPPNFGAGYNGPKVVTTYVYPPIPTRRFDWSAHYEGEEGEHMDQGWGQSKGEAITDLKDNYPRPKRDLSK